MNSNELEIVICAWQRYNPKRDQKNYTWFRLNNNIATDSMLYGLDAEQKFLWVVVLCQASYANSDRMTLNFDYLTHITGVKRDKILKTIDLFKEKNIVAVWGSVHDNTVSQLFSCATPTEEQTEEQTNEDRGHVSLREVPSLSDQIPNPIPEEYFEVRSILLERNVKPVTAERWLLSFPDTLWVMNQVRKAYAWEGGNPKNMKKDFGRFITNWLNREWDKRGTGREIYNPNKVRPGFHL